MNNVNIERLIIIPSGCQKIRVGRFIYPDRIEFTLIMYLKTGDVRTEIIPFNKLQQAFLKNEFCHWEKNALADNLLEYTR